MRMTGFGRFAVSLLTAAGLFLLIAGMIPSLRQRMRKKFFF